MVRSRFLQLIFPCVVLLFGFRTAVAQDVPSPGSTSGGDFSQLPPEKVPENVIIVKGAEPSASDHATPLPEDGFVSKNVYQNRYLGLSYSLPADWTETLKGPPPSDSGGYVLSELIPAPSFKGTSRGIVLISAQDMFFARTPARNALELIRYHKEHLQPYYEVERAPVEVDIAGHSFARFDYASTVAGLHWYVLATQIRCHTLQFIFTGSDPEMLDGLVRQMSSSMRLPAEAGDTAGKGGGETPECIADYAVAANIVDRVDPVLEDRRFNAIPVRIIIGKNGKVRHVHVISAFPDQAARITEALSQWTFKPRMRDGKAVEVETGIMFGSARSRRIPTTPSQPAAATND
ncbi:MAG: energy transducer TonB [Thermoanaerobaculia bacterium]